MAKTQKPSGAGLNLDLLEQLAFYGKYHRHPVNQLIHFFFVPTIVWTVLVWLARFSTPWTLTLPFAPSVSVHPSAALAVVVAYTFFYLCLDSLAGLTWALLIGFPACFLAHYARDAYPAKVDTFALGLHVFSWYMQIHPGHAVFEKRKPALLDSLIQAFALAPLFVWYELLFLLGYRKQLKADLDARVAALVEQDKKATAAAAAAKRE